MTETNQLSAAARARSNVQSAVHQAAQRTSIDFDFLLAQARLESGLRPNAKARTSSATGLFQFIESTWLATMKRHGPSLGFGDVAASIKQSGNRFYVADPGQRRNILNLRKDPQIASLMAGALAQDNREALLPVLGREPQPTELYMAHFLGAGDARRFFSELHRNPTQSAPALFPRPASANQSIFFQRNGAERNLGEVLGLMQRKMNRAIAANDRMPQPLQQPLQQTSPQPARYAQPAPQLQRQPWIEPQIDAVMGVRGEGDFPRQAARSIPPASRPSYGGVALPNELPPAPRLPEPPPPPLSEMLRQTFTPRGYGPSEGAQEQMRRAYDKMKALGL
jgi:hypothetical protein